jgi:hypothetical protein
MWIPKEPIPDYKEAGHIPEHHFQPKIKVKLTMVFANTTSL